MDFGDFEAQPTYSQSKGPGAFENFYFAYGGESSDDVRKHDNYHPKESESE